MDEIKAIPRNRYIGMLADALGATKSATGPVGDFLLGDAPRTLDQMSYGFSPVRMGRTDQGLAGALYGMQVDPGLMDVAGVAGMAPVAGRVGAWAGREALGQIDDAMIGGKNSILARALSGIAPRGVLPNTEGLSSRAARDVVQNEADEFAQKLQKMGFHAQAVHSGSLSGPSSYVKVSDPQTGRFIQDPFRFSNHGKGPFNAKLVNDIGPDFTIDDAMQMVQGMRDQGPTELFVAQQKAAEQARQRTIQTGLSRLEKGKSLTRTQEQLLKDEGLLPK